MDDATVGRALRALRMKKGWTQDELAVAARVSQSVVSRTERGHLAALRLASVRNLFAAVDAGCTVTPWWRSGEVDRLLDEDHALLVARAVAYLHRCGWDTKIEATFSVGSERGSYDIIATRRSDGAVLVVEVKSRLMSIEEMLRTLDRKVRLAAGVVASREGWRPTVIGRLVVLGEGSTSRRRVARATALDTALPARGQSVESWLRSPVGAMAGLMFLSVGTAKGVRSSLGRQRVRKRRATKPAAPRLA